MSWQPAPGPLMTPWANDVRPDAVWPFYPRPQMTRPEWRNLNSVYRKSLPMQQKPLDQINNRAET